MATWTEEREERSPLPGRRHVEALERSRARAHQRHQLARTPRAAWLDRSFVTVAGGVLVALIGAGALIGNTVAGLVLDDPRDGAVTTCTVAQQGVKKSLDLGVNTPELLDKINVAKVDEQCGDEVAIACDILDEPSDTAAAADRKKSLQVRLKCS